MDGQKIYPRLVKRYGGNPLSLKGVAGTISVSFGGDIIGGGGSQIYS